VTRVGKGSDVREYLSLLLPPLTILGVLAGFWLLYQAALTPAPMPAMTTSPASFASPPSSTYPPELLAAAIAISTSLAPTPTWTPSPPSPTSAAIPATVALICGDGVTAGTVCQWGPFTPTPEPTPGPCLTPIPLASCIWMGSRAGTPVAIGGAVRGT
jgi:hypothetical protein